MGAGRKKGREKEKKRKGNKDEETMKKPHSSESKKNIKKNKKMNDYEKAQRTLDAINASLISNEQASNPLLFFSTDDKSNCCCASSSARSRNSRHNVELSTCDFCTTTFSHKVSASKDDLKHAFSISPKHSIGRARALGQLCAGGSHDLYQT